MAVSLKVFLLVLQNPSTLIGVLIVLHALAAAVWVGGMFVMHTSLRPAAAEVLEPPQRLPLLCGVLSRFFVWVKGAITVLFVSGTGLIYLHGSFGKAGWHVHLMVLIAVIMAAIFGMIYGGPFKQLKAAVAAKEWPKGGAAMVTIRKLIFINLVLGLITVAVGAGGRYLPM